MAIPGGRKCASASRPPSARLTRPDGIVSKRPGSPYRCRTSRDWLKTKVSRDRRDHLITLQRPSARRGCKVRGQGVVAGSRVPHRCAYSRTTRGWSDSNQNQSLFAFGAFVMIVETMVGSSKPLRRGNKPNQISRIFCIIHHSKSKIARLGFAQLGDCGQQHGLDWR